MKQSSWTFWCKIKIRFNRWKMSARISVSGMNYSIYLFVIWYGSLTLVQKGKNYLYHGIKCFIWLTHMVYDFLISLPNSDILNKFDHEADQPFFCQCFVLFLFLFLFFWQNQQKTNNEEKGDLQNLIYCEIWNNVNKL